MGEGSFPHRESDLRPQHSCRSVRNAGSRMWRREADRGESHYGGEGRSEQFNTDVRHGVGAEGEDLGGPAQETPLSRWGDYYPE